MRRGRWVMLPRGLLSLHGVPFSHRGRAVTAKERDVVRGNNKWELGRSLWTERACWYPSLQFFRSVYTLCLVRMSVSRRFKRALVFCVYSFKVGRRFSLLSKGGERCCQIGLAPTSLWNFSMPSCESGATSPSSQITCKTTPAKHPGTGLWQHIRRVRGTYEMDFALESFATALSISK